MIKKPGAKEGKQKTIHSLLSCFVSLSKIIGLYVCGLFLDSIVWFTDVFVTLDNYTTLP